jgi:hypothetical protein
MYSTTNPITVVASRTVDQPSYTLPIGRKITLREIGDMLAHVVKHIALATSRR